MPDEFRCDWCGTPTEGIKAFCSKTFEKAREEHETSDDNICRKCDRIDWLYKASNYGEEAYCEYMEKTVWSNDPACEGGFKPS